VVTRHGPLVVSRQRVLVVINPIIPVTIIILVFKIIHSSNVNVKIKIVKVSVRLSAFRALVVTKYNRITYSTISREFKE
jgi:hypothetical protein